MPRLRPLLAALDSKLELPEVQNLAPSVHAEAQAMTPTDTPLLTRHQADNAARICDQWHLSGPETYAIVKALREIACGRAVVLPAPAEGVDTGELCDSRELLPPRLPEPARPGEPYEDSELKRLCLPEPTADAKGRSK